MDDSKETLMWVFSDQNRIPNFKLLIDCLIIGLCA